MLACALTAVTAASAAARPAAAPTLAASGTTISFGSAVTLHGTLPGATAGQDVVIYAQPCGYTGPVPSGTATTTAGGKFSYALQPMLNAVFFAQAGDATSPSVAVRIRPQVQLRLVGPRTFGVDVSAGNGSWFTKSVTLQRYDTRAKTWKPVTSGSLKANSDPGALVAVSSATLHATVKAGTKVRAVVTQATVGSCFLPAASASLVA